MGFRVTGDDGTVVAEGDDLDALREQVRPRLRAQLAAASASLERRGLRDWSIGELPRVVALPGTGEAVRGYPALVDEGDSVAVRVLESPGAQAAAMRAGTRRLLLLTVPSPLRAIRAPVSLAVAPHGSVEATLEDALLAAVDALVDEAGGPAWDEAAWRALRAHVAGRLATRTQEVVDAVGRILDAEREVRRRLESLTAPALQDAAVDVARQLGALLYPGFVAATGAARLDDVERYVRAAARRLERLPDAVAVDRDRMNAIHALQAEYRARMDAWPRGRPAPAALRDVRWQLEELRVSQFAQALGTRGPVSAKRIRRALADAAP
jgi:ATP-dependent helicase HrpA